MFYWFAWCVCRAILLLVRRWQVEGAENLPRQGGVVIAANHISYWDPVVVGCAFKRRVFFLAKEELFRIPFFATLITKLGAFPVRREAMDRRALRLATEKLAAGNPVVVFPEGTRSHTGELLQPHLGAALLAIRGGVPILPVAVYGTRGIIGKVRVRVGKPIYFPELYGTKPSKASLAAVSSHVMEKIAELLSGMR